MDLPFESFVAVKRNYVDYSAPRVNEGPAGGKMLSLGIVLSRFAFNEVRLDVGCFVLFSSRDGGKKGWVLYGIALLWSDL